MGIKIGINGFGRIGRVITRLVTQEKDLEVVQINDLSSPEMLAHLFKYDSIHGTYAGQVEAMEASLEIDGRSIVCSAEKEPESIGWGDQGVDVVLECTGRFRDRSGCEGHLKAGAKKVILSAPGKNVDLTVVMGVNQGEYRPDQHQVLSNASCTTNCLAPVAKVINDHLGILHGYMTTIHSYTNDQVLLDAVHKDPRRARAGALSQVPTTTGAARAIGLVLPELDGKLEGMSIRVPTPNVSLLDLIVEVSKAASGEQVNQFLDQAAQGPLSGILDVSHEPLVSIDYNGSRFSAVVDGLSTNVVGERLVKVLAWYDNETGFSHRMVDLAKFVGKDLG